VRSRVLLVGVLLTFGTLGMPGHAGVVAAGSPPATEPPSTVPTSTLNDFIPEQRAISDCISAVPKPGCGSEAQSDWHTWLAFIALVGGLAFVGWRVVTGLRRQRTEPEQTEAPTR
jgi:hypothetical protein